MKKTLLMAVVLVVLVLPVRSGERFSLSITGSYYAPSDDGYRTIYGKGMMVPELKAGIKLYRGLYAWLSYGHLRSEGTLPVIGDAATSTQHLVSAGAGYRWVLSGFLELGLQLGSFNVIYSEETPGDRESGLAYGYRADIHCVVFIGDHLFMGVSGGYLRAAKSVDSTTVTFGGFRGGLEIGYRF